MRSNAAAAMDWERLAATLPFQTAVAIREKWQQQEYGDAMHGVEELIDALSRAEERALARHLIHVMPHIMQWKRPPARRSRRGMRTIRHGRNAMRKLQQNSPRLTDQVIRAKIAVGSPRIM